MKSHRPRCWTAIDVQQLQCLERLLPGRNLVDPSLLNSAPLWGSTIPAVPAVSSIHWPQAKAACLAKCNFRSHWLTTVVHELVNRLYFIQSSGSKLHSFGLLSLTSGSPSSSPFGNTLPGFHIPHSSIISKSHPWESEWLPTGQLAIDPTQETNVLAHTAGRNWFRISWSGSTYSAVSPTPASLRAPWVQESRAVVCLFHPWVLAAKTWFLLPLSRRSLALLSKGSSVHYWSNRLKENSLGFTSKY